MRLLLGHAVRRALNHALRWVQDFALWRALNHASCWAQGRTLQRALNHALRWAQGYALWRALNHALHWALASLCGEVVAVPGGRLSALHYGEHWAMPCGRF